MDADFFWRVPEYLAEQLSAALGIPMLDYRPANMKDALDVLSSGLVDWEPGLSIEPFADQVSTVQPTLVIAVFVDGSGQGPMKSLRQLVGQAMAWVNQKGSLTGDEVGTGVKRLSVIDVDWRELSEETGLELHGRVVQAGGLLVQLQLYDRR